jgi:N-acetylglucosaminyldiphosphoundecaprenol N-acetyl-beta-D-mannosaminyltransferase
MGSPTQESWTREHLARVGGVTALTVGGLFDFYSGRIARAPIAVRELGLEWAWRLLQEPGRLARRYLLGNPHFLGLAMMDRRRFKSA